MLVLRPSVLQNKPILAFRVPEPPGWPSSARRLALKAQVAQASIGVARGPNVRLLGRLLQNKPNFCTEGPAVYEGPRSTLITFDALLMLIAFDALLGVGRLLWLPLQNKPNLPSRACA
jgi:hypothetical protein